jgi:hypothetical protein
MRWSAKNACDFLSILSAKPRRSISLPSTQKRRTGPALNPVAFHLEAFQAEPSLRITSVGVREILRNQTQFFGRLVDHEMVAVLRFLVPSREDYLPGPERTLATTRGAPDDRDDATVTGCATRAIEVESNEQAQVECPQGIGPRGGTADASVLGADVRKDVGVRFSPRPVVLFEVIGRLRLGFHLTLAARAVR